MIIYITVKDIISFFRLERKVFIWLLICMVCGSFVLNYSYSFARYRGAVIEYNSGDTITRYKINCNSTMLYVNRILTKVSGSGFPEIKNYQIFGKSKDGYTIVGSSYISSQSSSYTGLWREGYAAEIKNEGEKVCAVDESIISYAGRLKMVGEEFFLDGEKFIIKGVYEDSNIAQVVIFADDFADMYDTIDGMWVTFSERLDENQCKLFEQIIKENIQHGNMICPPEPGTLGSEDVKSNEIQYSAIIIMLMVCIVSLIKYWQSVNLSSYTIYWINGARKLTILCVALCESVILCVSTYLVGLGLNAAFRNIMSFNISLTVNDALIGFGIFFGVFTIFTLINTSKICKQFKVADIRRD